MLRNLDRQTFSAFVPDPFASREDLLKMVLMDFGVISIDDLTGSRLNVATRTELSYLLYEFLRGLAPLQAFAVVVIDEAQNLSPSLLEEIRILSDCDGRERQLQVVLIGQPAACLASSIVSAIARCTAVTSSGWRRSTARPFVRPSTTSG